MFSILEVPVVDAECMRIKSPAKQADPIKKRSDNKRYYENNKDIVRENRRDRYDAKGGSGRPVGGSHPFKEIALGLLADGMSKSEVSKKLKLSKTTVYRWAAA